MKLTNAEGMALHDAATAVEHAKEALKEATAEREALIRATARAGHSYRQISDAARVSFQRVGQIVGEDRRLDFMAVKEAYCPKCEAQPGEPCDSKTAMFHAERHDRRMLIHEGDLDEVFPGEPTYVA